MVVGSATSYRIPTFPFLFGAGYILAMADHVDRYIPAETNGGWGFAAFIGLLTVALIIAVTYIHKETYRPPTDVTWHGRGSGDTPEHK